MDDENTQYSPPAPFVEDGSTGDELEHNDDVYSDADDEYEDVAGKNNKRPTKPAKSANITRKRPKNNLCDTSSLFKPLSSAHTTGQQNEAPNVQPLKEDHTRFKEAVDEYFANAKAAGLAKDITKKMFHEARGQFKGRRLKPRNECFGTGHWWLKGMKCNLYHHQFLAIGAMIKIERQALSDKANPQGGLLSDEPGSGKTNTVLATILEGRKNGTKRMTTLIVVPSSLVQQWYNEIHKHFEDGVFGNICIYQPKHPNGNKYMLTELKKSRLIIATYAAVTRSYPSSVTKQKKPEGTGEQNWSGKELEKHLGPLHKVEFHRVVLDEAHAIKNHNSLTSIACRALKAKVYWAMTGTPLHNTVDEMFAYFSFLKVPGATSLREFKRKFPMQSQQQDSNDDNCSRVDLLEKIMIRRTNTATILGQVIVPLTKKDEQTIEVPLTKSERICYAALGTWAKDTTKEILQREKRKKHNRTTMSLLLTIIQRLREMTSHFLLVAPLLALLEDADLKSLISESFGSTATANVDLDHVTAMLQMLSAITLKHSKGVSSKEFLQKYLCISNEDAPNLRKAKKAGSKAGKTPDKVNQSKKKKKRKNPLKFNLQKWLEKGGQILYPAKFKVAIKQIEEWRTMDASNKIIVFFQYNEVLKMFGEVCTQKGWGHRLFYGSMNAYSKTNAIDAFNNDDEVFILAASLKCGGVGLNLEVASRVIIFDLWWNTAIEDQATARVHRLGQKKPIEVIKLATVDTIDDKIRKLQEEKGIAINEVMSGQAKAKDGPKMDYLMKLLDVERPTRKDDGDKEDGDEISSNTQDEDSDDPGYGSSNWGDSDSEDNSEESFSDSGEDDGDF